MRLRFFGTILIALLIAWPASAQEQRGSIEGTVKDSSGGALPGASVEAKGLVSSTSTFSDAAGRYRFPALPPGRYEVTATLTGFARATVQNVELALGQILKVDLTLALARVAETVKVTGEAPLIDIKQSARFATIREEQIQKLPKGRDFTSLVTQAPGAISETKAGGISIDGASGSENRYIIDGIETTQIISGVSGKALITDFVEEVQVKSSGYTAEYGGSTGGVINVITRTGTNQWKFEVGAYYTSDKLEGSERRSLRRKPADTSQAEYVTFPKDSFTRWEPGFSAGGPVVTDRVWGFASYQPALVSTDRAAPLRQDDGSTITVSRNEDVKTHYATANLTSQLNEKSRAKVTFNLSSRRTKGLLPARDGSDSAKTNFDVTTSRPDYTLSASLDHIATNNLYFGLRGGYYFADTSQEGVYQGPYYIFQRANINLPGVPAELQRIVNFRTQVSNSETRKDQRTRLSAQLDGTYYFSFSGEHAVKAGVQFDRLGNNVDSGETGNRVQLYWNTNLDGERGQFGYYTVRSQGPANPKRGFTTFGNVHSDNVGLFLQDSWTIQNRLTLNLGLRTEGERVPSFTTEHGESGTAINFRFKDKLAPRLGFAWDVTGNSRWKVYGSWGVFYDIMKLNLPRGSFGGEKWLEYYYTLDTPNSPSKN